MNNHYQEIREAANRERMRLGSKWDTDNRALVAWTIDQLQLCGSSRRVIRWAYGYDGSPCSFEGIGNGTSAMKDMYFDNCVKNPYGTGHDMLFILHHLDLPLPDGSKPDLHWCNDWYDDAMEDFGWDTEDDVERLGLYLFSLPFWWGWAPEGRKLRRLRKLSVPERIAKLQAMSVQSFSATPTS
jgi:hypothetical protein